jgi:peptidoglycan/xylan/chitin deacetylase (PgdA/CDA1 family)
MGITMPAGARVAFALTIDFDAHSPWIGAMRMTTPSAFSRGDFGADVGVPRLLALLRQLEIPATWFTPGHDLVTFPHRIEQILTEGHEVAAHGCYHETLTSLDADEERRLMEVQLRQHKEVTGLRPRGYRSPAWDFTDATMSILEDAGFAWDSTLMGREFEPYHPRPVTMNYETANEFGPESSLLEFPVSWYLDDWPAVEYVPGISPQLGSHETMFSRWSQIYDYAFERVPGALYTLTVHPQCIGRSHHIAALEALLTEIRDRGSVWFARLSDVYDAHQD